MAFEGFINEYPDFPIGTFNSDGDDEKQSGTCVIEVYPNEGEHIPHMHIHNADKKFNVCVRLDKPEYFKHGPYQDEFNSKQKKEFNKIMHTITYYDPERTYWQSACASWNKHYEKDKIDFLIIKDVDYSKLP